MPLKLEEYFDANTMSVHLRENVHAMAKKGKPGAWEFVKVSKKPLTTAEVEGLADEVIHAAEERTDAFIDVDRPGSTIAQVGRYRIVIVRPPLGDGWEITAVRPITTLALKDYELSEKLKARIGEQAEGILIAGAPGMGKSTFSQALATHYSDQGKIVKTVEAPRDLALPENITQLAIGRGTPEEIHDILLLSRPDYTLFDEMRNPKDFELFSDLRLAGVGMVGVVHGTNPMDAIQRFIGKVDLGVIPHVIDTVVFIKNGRIDQVLSIHMEVKVPSGMTEADLARPTVVINDFETGKPVAEIYTYGEQTIVVPVQERKQTGAQKLAANAIKRALQKYADHVDVEIISNTQARVFVPAKNIPAIIGKEGRRIAELEEQLGIGLQVEEHKGKPPKQGPRGQKEVPYQKRVSGKNLELILGTHLTGKDVSIYVEDDYLATFNVGKKGLIKIRKANPLGKTLIDAFEHDEKVRLVV